MDMKLNRIPDPVKTIHLIAVCGTAMGALALMLKEMGYQVTGSDQAVYPPMSDFLKNNGIALFNGYSQENLAHGPDLVVIGNAVRKDNPEALAAAERKIPFCSMPQALKWFAGKGKEAIVIAGTHGKTTTSSLMAWVLQSAGADPSFMVGGILNNFKSNYRIGRGAHIVFEGDEYNTAFFDKGPKFLHYDPAITILTSVEFDHADIFEDLNAVKSAFNALLSMMAPGSTLVACADDSNVASLVQGRNLKVLTYGMADHAMWRLGESRCEPPFQVFNIWKGEAPFGRFRIRMMGAYNLLNALSVVAVADSIGLSPEKIGAGLETFEGVKRRQEIRGVKNGVTIMDDFAHHPTAVKETLKGVRSFYRQGRIIAVFEPRTNSSKRRVFQESYPDAFADADMIVVPEPENLEKIPEGERFSSEKLVNDLAAAGKKAHYFRSVDRIVEFIAQTAAPGDVVLVMSSGGFGGIHEKLLKRL